MLAGALAALMLQAATATGQDDTGGDVELLERSPYSTVIRFMTESDFPPFNYLDEDGTLTGFNVDMARAICLELDVSCDVQAAPWEQLLPALERGETDAVIASISVTPETLAVADFSDRYYTTPARFAALKTSEDVDITPTSLEGRRIGVVEKTAHEAYLHDFFRDSIVVGYATQEAAREALMKGEVDVLFGDGFSLMFWLNGASSRLCCEFRGGPFADERYFGEGVGVAIRRGDTELKALVNKALRQIRANGRYEELFLRYFPIRVY